MRRLLVGLFVAGIAATGCTSGSDGGAIDRDETTYVGFDGDPGSIADYDGRPLVVNFFASWCVPCVTEMPALQEVHEELGDSVAFLGLAVNDTVEDAQDLVDRTGVTWDLGRDTRGDIVEALGGVGMPTTVLISADGEIVARHTGKQTADEFRTWIQAELLS